jgi:hypothetical protein
MQPIFVAMPDLSFHQLRNSPIFLHHVDDLVEPHFYGTRQSGPKTMSLSCTEYMMTQLLTFVTSPLTFGLYAAKLSILNLTLHLLVLTDSLAELQIPCSGTMCIHVATFSKPAILCRRLSNGAS